MACAVIDGLNVAFAGAKVLEATRGDVGPVKPSIPALLATVDFCRNRGIDAVAFVPDWWLRSKPGDAVMRTAKAAARAPTGLNESEQAAVRYLISTGAAVTVPAKDADDPYFLEYAWSRRAYVISNDRFIDHINRWLQEAQAEGSLGGVGIGSVGGASAPATAASGSSYPHGPGANGGWLAGSMDVEDDEPYGPAAGGEVAGTSTGGSGDGVEAKVHWLRSHTVSFALRPRFDAAAVATHGGGMSLSVAAASGTRGDRSVEPAAWEFLPNPDVWKRLMAEAQASAPPAGPAPSAEASHVGASFTAHGWPSVGHVWDPHAAGRGDGAAGGLPAYIPIHTPWPFEAGFAAAASPGAVAWPGWAPPSAPADVAPPAWASGAVGCGTAAFSTAPQAAVAFGGSASHDAGYDMTHSAPWRGASAAPSYAGTESDALSASAGLASTGLADTGLGSSGLASTALARPPAAPPAAVDATAAHAHTIPATAAHAHSRPATAASAAPVAEGKRPTGFLASLVPSNAVLY
jgi:hypothetical protein